MPPVDEADIVFYYAPKTRAFRTLWLLEEMGEPYRIEHVDFARGHHKRPEFLKLNPMGKLPTVVDRGIPIAETGAIFVYLADRYSRGTLAPDLDDSRRADYLRWLFFGAGVMEPAYGQKFFKWEVPSRQVAWGSFDDMLHVLTEAVSSREWLAGRFSAADIYVASSLRYGMLFGIIPTEGPLADYVGRWNARPASQRAAEIDQRYMPRERT